MLFLMAVDIGVGRMRSDCLPVMGQRNDMAVAGTVIHLFMAIPASLVLLVATASAGMKAPVLTIRISAKAPG